MAIEARHPGVYVDEVPGQPKITGVGVATAAFVGRCKKGPTNRATLVTGMTQFEERYGGYMGTSFGYMPIGIRGYFEEGGSRAYIARAVGSGAAKANATLTAYGSGPVAGSVLSGNSQTYNLEPGQTLLIDPDGNGNQTVTFAATAATRAGSGSTFASIVGGETLIVSFSGGESATVLFVTGDTTAAKVAQRINSAITGGHADVNGSEVDLVSDQRGSGATVVITGGTGLTLLGHTAGTTNGTGDAANIDAVTALEAVTAINSQTTDMTASVEGGKVRISSDLTGSGSSIKVDATSTATGFGFDNSLHSGSDSAVVDALTITADNEGAWGNDLKAATTRYSTTTTAQLSNAGTSVALSSVRNVEKGDLLLIVNPADDNYTVVHVYDVNAGTKTVYFQACELADIGTPLASGSTVSCSTMHRRSTTLAADADSADEEITVAQSFGIVEGAHVTIDDGTNLFEGKVLAINGNVVRLDTALGADFAEGTMVATQEFLLQIYEAGVLKETHQYLSMEPDNVQDYVEKRLAGKSNESQYRIVAEDLGATPDPLFYRAPQPQTATLSGGLDGSALTADDLIGEESPASGLHLLDTVQDVNRFAAPGVTDVDWVLGATAYAESSAHNAAINAYFDTPLEADTADEMLDFRRFDTNVDSRHALLYGPWFYEKDPQNPKGLIAVPPTGRVLGRVSDVAARRGPHVTAANVTLRNVRGLVVDISDGEQDLLNDAGVNIIRFFPGQGIRIWGGRTLQSLQDGQQFAAVSEFTNFIKQSFITGMRFAVFEPNDPRLWRAIERTGGAFLSSLWNQGQLFPSDDEERAYFVKCDAETNAQATIDEGKVIAEVGFNPLKPAEKVIFRLGAWDGGTSVEEEIQRRG